MEQTRKNVGLHNIHARSHNIGLPTHAVAVIKICYNLYATNPNHVKVVY